MTEGSSAKVSANLARVYPEIGAGGFSRIDGTIEFYTRIHSLCRSDMTVLDIGAGRGGQIHDAPTEFLRNLLTFKGKVARTVGADVDPVVRENPFLDHAEVIEPGAAMPFSDGEFDLVYADWVLEHVATPGAFAREIGRILKPGGWFCARTPNRWGMTGLATNLVPSKYHAAIVGRLQPGRIEKDVFPTTYLLNTAGQLHKHFPGTEWDHFSYRYNSEPPYIQRSRAAIRLVNAYLRLTPEFLATNLFIFLRKKG
jgi:SAM-dependent methyltransferase